MVEKRSGRNDECSKSLRLEKHCCSPVFSGYCSNSGLSPPKRRWTDLLPCLFGVSCFSLVTPSHHSGSVTMLMCSTALLQTYSALVPKGSSAEEAFPDSPQQLVMQEGLHISHSPWIFVLQQHTPAPTSPQDEGHEPVMESAAPSKQERRSPTLRHEGSSCCHPDAPFSQTGSLRRLCHRHRGWAEGRGLSKAFPDHHEKASQLATSGP